MKTFWLAVVFLFGALLATLNNALGQNAPGPADAQIVVDAGRVANSITPWMTGACIEDVNHEIYGGLYDQKLFGESFEEPPAAARFAGWTAYGGAWRAQGTVCRVDSQAGAKLVRVLPDFADGAVEAEVRFPENHGENAGLLVRVQNPGVGADAFDGYEISLNPGVQRVLLARHRHDFHLLQDAPATVEKSRWNRLRVVLDGAHIRVYLNGGAMPVLDFTDSDAPLVSGKIALRTWNTQVSFQNVRIFTGGNNALENTFDPTGGESVSGQWDAITSDRTAANFLRDENFAFNGRYCQKIEHGAGTGIVGIANRGLNRWGIAVKKGQTFQGHLYLRADSLRGPVTVALQSADGKVTYARSELRRVTAQWAKTSFTLTANAGEKNARFAVWIDRPGTLWVDQAVLTGTGSEQFHGLPIRADIAEALATEGITFLRYGGTMVNVPGYRWKNMIGNPDRRPPYVGNWYPYASNGFGIFDFLRFCEAAQFGAAFALNAEETAQDAADLADYLTAPVTTSWGRKRASDGHPRPYQVRFIEIGNEENISGSSASGFAHYAERVKIIADAIHSRNPKIPLVCAAWWVPDSPAMKVVFQAAEGRCAAWDLHVGSDEARSGTEVDRQIAQMESLFKQWDPNTSMKAVIFEENGGRHDMQRALGHATTLNASRRHGDFVLADCPANALQPWQQNDNGWDQGQLFFTPDHVWPMPPFYAQQMASRNYQPLRVASRMIGRDTLDVIATRSQDGRTLVLSVVNTGTVAQATAISLTGFGEGRVAAHLWTLAADLPTVNPPDGPEKARPQESAFAAAGPNFAYTFPAHSFTVLRLTR